MVSHNHRDKLAIDKEICCEWLKNKIPLAPLLPLSLFSLKHMACHALKQEIPMCPMKSVRQLDPTLTGVILARKT